MAGVSWKTVSNVMHHPDRVRPENRERVNRAVEQLGYRMSAVGRHLRQGRSRVIALAVPDIAGPYFAQLSRSIIRCAGRVGHSVLIDDTGGDPEREKAAASGYAVQFADAVILSPTSVDSAMISQVHPHTPVVLLGELDLPVSEDGMVFDRVAIDNVGSAREVTVHLVATGRRRLAFVGLDGRGQGTGHLRQQGFLAALDSAGLRPEAAVEAAAWDRAGGERAVAELLASGVELDGVVCGNDLLAIGAMKAIRDAGRTVGPDIAVAGWDDTEEGRYAHPSLTTVAHDLEALAATVVDLLVRRIEGSTEPAALHTVAHRLVVRDSTAH